MTYGIPNTPMNQTLASTVASRITADARRVSATAAFWRLLGLGGLLFLAGLGLGAAFFGYSYVTDTQVTMNKLSASIADALSKVTLKADGTVRADGTVELAGATVKLDSTGSTVRLDTTDTTVPLDTSRLSNALRPSPQQLQPDSRPASNVTPVTDYTIFKSLRFGRGEVVTGWRFRSNEDTAPWQQYCYYSQGSMDDSNSDTRYNVGLNGVILQPGGNFPGDIQEAFSNCVWWRAS